VRRAGGCGRVPGAGGGGVTRPGGGVGRTGTGVALACGFVAARAGGLLAIAPGRALASDPGGTLRKSGAPGACEPAPDSRVATELSVTALLISMRCSHLRHFIRTARPATFSSAIWYFALQLGQMNFIQQNADLWREARGSTANKIARR
jgi:hypothetical protein